jgi:hypothetical protein
MTYRSDEDIREVNEGKQYQGMREVVIYTVTTTPVGDSPSSVSVAVKDITISVTGAQTVTTTVMPAGSPSVNGNVITLPPLRALTAGHVYRVEITGTIDGNALEHYVDVEAQP